MMYLAVAINSSSNQVVSTIISIYTLSKCYHTELVFTDNTSLICDPKGVRYCSRDYDLYNWSLIPLPWISSVQEYKIRMTANQIVDSKPKYDYIGAIFGKFNSTWQEPDRWFCSELCAYLLAPYTSVITGKKWWSPEKLWKTVNQYFIDNYTISSGINCTVYLKK